VQATYGHTSNCSNSVNIIQPWDMKCLVFSHTQCNFKLFFCVGPTCNFLAGVNSSASQLVKV